MGTSKTNSRPMGYAISKLFKDAYATYREHMYKVDLIETGEPIILTWEAYNKMKNRLRLLDPETFTGLALPSFEEPKTENQKLTYVQDFISKVRINEIEKVVARLTPELESFMCDNCNNFVRGTSFVNGVSQFKFLCKECGGNLSQAPILVRRADKKNSEDQEREDRKNKPIVLYIKASKKSCPHCGVEDWLGLTIRDPEQPMGSLYWICKHCKKYVEQYQVFKQWGGGYRPQEPTENLTKGITVSLANVEDVTLKPLIFEGFLNKNACEGVFYSDDIAVSQVTWGYKLGQYDNVRYKTFPNHAYYGRKLRTQGIVVRLKPEVYEECLKYLKELYKEDSELYKEFMRDIENEDPEMSQMQLKRWILHTLKHALLVFMPIITGLPNQEFSGSYDLEKNQVIIYDNQEGGIGGCKKLWDDSNNFIDLLDLLTETIEKCDCRNKCPKCILLDTCGEVNQALNRHLLVPIFKSLDTFYD